MRGELGVEDVNQWNPLQVLCIILSYESNTYQAAVRAASPMKLFLSPGQTGRVANSCTEIFSARSLYNEDPYSWWASTSLGTTANPSGLIVGQCSEVDMS